MAASCSNPYPLTRDSSEFSGATKRIRRSDRVVRTSRNGIHIQKRTRMGRSATEGYFLETGQDCYSLLKEYTVE